MTLESPQPSIIFISPKHGRDLTAAGIPTAYLPVALFIFIIIIYLSPAARSSGCNFRNQLFNEKQFLGVFIEFE